MAKVGTVFKNSGNLNFDLEIAEIIEVKDGTCNREIIFLPLQNVNF